MPQVEKSECIKFHENDIQQLLFCDNSDTEQALTLDEEDIGFLNIDCCN